MSQLHLMVELRIEIKIRLLHFIWFFGGLLFLQLFYIHQLD